MSERKIETTRLCAIWRRAAITLGAVAAVAGLIIYSAIAGYPT